MYKLQIDIAQHRYSLGISDYQLAAMIKKAFVMLSPKIICDDESDYSPIFTVGCSGIPAADSIGEFYSFIRERIEAQLEFDYRDDVLLHGACVCLNDTALCILAPTGTGKSTLAMHLCTDGFTYYSDDLVIIKDNLPLAVRLPLEFRKGGEISDSVLGRIGKDGIYTTSEKFGVTDIVRSDNKILKTAYVFLDSEKHDLTEIHGAECLRRLLLSLKCGNVSSDLIDKLNKIVRSSDFYSLGRLSPAEQENRLEKICKLRNGR